MKFSKFNVYKKYNDQEYWVFNTLTTALIILENEKLTEEESNLLKELLLDDASNIKNMPDFVTRIENACK